MPPSGTAPQFYVYCSFPIDPIQRLLPFVGHEDRGDFGGAGGVLKLHEREPGLHAGLGIRIEVLLPGGVVQAK
jgi:hypothetical protein